MKLISKLPCLRSARYLWICGIIFFSLNIEACHNAAIKPNTAGSDLPVSIKPVLINQLGNEHFANAVYRRGMNGPRITASGNRILEWPIQSSAATSEVVPVSPESYQNGACAFDLNNDNIDELIVGRTAKQQGTDLLWFEEVAGQAYWKEHFIANIRKSGGEEGFHDIMPFHMNVSGKTVLGVAIVVNRTTLYWYEIPDDISKPWKQHMIADLGVYGGKLPQSGLVLGDISGNGRQDIVCGNYWVECPADPTTGSWQVHRYSDWDRRTTPIFAGIPEWVNKLSFGGMNQLDLGDMDGDGKLDIIASDAEIPDARVGIFCRNMDNSRNQWNTTIIDTGLYCPHSLVVADFNADNRPDILVGEMTAGGWWFPRNPDPGLYMYLNQGNLKFRKYVVHRGWGTHMMRMAPQQSNDSIFVFAADEIQSWYKDMTTHIVGWTISPGQ